MFLNIGTDTDTNICDSLVKTSGKLTSLLCFCLWATDAACWSWTARLLSSLLCTESAWWCGSFGPPLSGPRSLPETDSRRGASWGNKADPMTPKYPTRATQTERSLLIAVPQVQSLVLPNVLHDSDYLQRQHILPQICDKHKWLQIETKMKPNCHVRRSG